MEHIMFPNDWMPELDDLTEHDLAMSDQWDYDREWEETLDAIEEINMKRDAAEQVTENPKEGIMDIHTVTVKDVGELQKIRVVKLIEEEIENPRLPFTTRDRESLLDFGKKLMLNQVKIAKDA